MKLKWISWLPALMIMGVIFYFSAKPAVNSDESSRTIANFVIKLYEDITDTELNGRNRNQLLDSANHVIRKGAHVTEYAILACAVAFHLYVWGKRRKINILLSVVISAFYAMTDEIHQLYIPGRSGELRDVIIDTSGALAGALIFCLICSIKHKIRVKN